MELNNELQQWATFQVREAVAGMHLELSARAIQKGANESYLESFCWYEENLYLSLCFNGYI